MYLRYHTSNKASSVLYVFQNSIEKFGFPSRVHADQGVENVKDAQFMLTHPLRGSRLKKFHRWKVMSEPVDTALMA